MTLAVIGTGTEVGKTVVSALLLARYGAALPLAYWKPVATGARDGRDSVEVARLAGHRAAVLPETYLFGEPLSPHLAARREDRRIEPGTVLAEYRRHRAAGRGLLIEGVGGLLVPLAAGWLLADLLGDLLAEASRQNPAAEPAGHRHRAMEPGLPPGLACVLVAHSGLGTINHTLLTLEAMRVRGLPAAAVVLNGPPNPENRRAIESFGAVWPVFEVAPLAALDRASVERAAAGLDPQGLLAPFLEPCPVPRPNIQASPMRSWEP
ncbi:MAG TPA: dethiobiotin synthase [Thermoanaerobaculia bacterium]|nr:dethiobiotin synthase [Thermoanaerobaculia bacterium]